MTDSEGRRERLSPGLLLLYALAWSGGSIAYVPFLSILLPVKVEALAGPDASVSWLAYIAFFGAIASSFGNIAAGYLSDITRRRRMWTALGLGLSSVLLVLTGQARSLPGLIAVIGLWQLALNLMLAPLAARAGDIVPDSQKGLLGGLLAFAPALGAVSTTLVTWPGLSGQDFRLIFVALLVSLCVVPFLLFDRLPEGVADAAADGRARPASAARVLLARRMWFARLAVQVAEAALFSYLYLWFRSVDPAMSDSRVARVFTVVLVASVPLALIVGQWADRRDRPLAPLIGSALASSVGLAGMAVARTLTEAVAAYALFGLASSVFLALHSAQTLRVLPRSDRRGRDLGLFNLTNTVPSLVMPWFAVTLVPRFGFSAMFIAMALLAIVAALSLIRLPNRA